MPGRSQAFVGKIIYLFLFCQICLFVSAQETPDCKEYHSATAGTSLRRNEFICSDNESYRFGVSSDGLVSFWSNDDMVWSAQFDEDRESCGDDVSCPIARIQSDGNLVVYNPNIGRSIWRKKTDSTDASIVTVQDNGFLRMTQNDILIWSLEAPTTDTSQVEAPEAIDPISDVPEILPDDSTSNTETVALPSFEDVTVRCGFLGTSWDTVPTVEKEAAMNLGYDQCSWEYPPFQNLDYIEYYPWWNITDEEKSDAETLGCNELSWNKMISHYYSYYWQDFVADGIAHCLRKLGYNKRSWDEGTNPPVSETQSFDELSDNARRGAECLGYTQSTWDTSWEVDCYALKYGTDPPVLV